jgi:hypothetical protein
MGITFLLIYTLYIIHYRFQSDVELLFVIGNHVVAPRMQKNIDRENGHNERGQDRMKAATI